MEGMTVNERVFLTGQGQVRQSQVSTECNRLGESTELLLKMLTDLEERLGPILRPELNAIETPRNGADKRAEPLAPHADFLQSRNHMLVIATAQLDRILNRLEL